MDNQDVFPTVHFLDEDIRESVDPIVINLIGVGGTGSHVLANLADMAIALRGLGHPGLFVNVFDDDKVSTSNLGRQRFAQAEVGLSKAASLVTRINRFHGLNWRSLTFPFSSHYNKELKNFKSAPITISCVDTVASRFDIEKVLMEEARNLYNYNNRSNATYWMDFGNSRFSGQMFLSTLKDVSQPSSKKYTPVPRLPLFTEEYKAKLKAVKDKAEPSCSMQEALRKQDLFINSTLALVGCRLLWNLLAEGMTLYRGIFVNVKDFKIVPVPVPALVERRSAHKRAA